LQKFVSRPQDHAAAIIEFLRRNPDITEKVSSLSFDTTSVNTDIINDVCARIIRVFPNNKLLMRKPILCVL
jgi:hypothetical protein